MSLEKYKKSIDEFEEFLLNHKIECQSFHPYYQDALWEMVICGGKRFRPKLILATISAIEPTMIQNSFLPALAVETLHTYSLIHDDLPAMDDSPLRRGYKTLHKKYDEAGAILIGDALNTYSFYLLSISKLDSKVKVEIIRELSYSGGVHGMVLGQALDCYFEGETLDIEKVKFIHTNKTGKLIAVSLKIGGIISNQSREFCERIYDFGIDLGLFFQIRDDIIDVIQDESEAGKKTQNDGSKNSYPNLLGIEKARESFVELRERIIKEMDEFPPGLRENLDWLLRDYFRDI